MDRLEIIYLSPDALIENPRNARKHSPKQVEQISRSIKSFGFNSPILRDRNNMIIAGHGRVAAAKALGLSEVPSVLLDHLTKVQKRAFIIADNRMSELSEWDESMLAQELDEILKLDAPFEITDTGFEIPRIDLLIEDVHNPKADADPSDEPIDPQTVEAVARMGDLWLCGRHRIFCGDALDPLSYEILLGGETAQMVFIDPPYNVPIDGHVSGLGKARHREFAMASGEMSEAQFTDFLSGCLRLLSSASMDGAVHYVCMDWRHLRELLGAGHDVYDMMLNLCVWTKSQGGMGSLYRSQHELVAVFRSGQASHISNVELGKHGRNRTNVWSYPGMNSFQKRRREKLAMHPTVKPVALVADAMLDCSTRGGLILDTFGGSGTTMIAAERSGRRAALLELDPRYVDVTLRRFCDVTGIEPVNAWTGQVVIGEAKKLRSEVTAQTHPIYATDEEDDDIFHYIDTASSRVHIGVDNEKLEGQRVAIIGVGGTGSYILDLIAKTRVAEIRLFDGDSFDTHNAFRAPGAWSLAELEAKKSKVHNLYDLYSKLRRKGLVKHDEPLTSENLHLLEGINFAFICIDSGKAKRAIVDWLIANGVAFIEVGLGIIRAPAGLQGIVRVVSSTAEKRDHIDSRITFGADDEAENEYSTNIQIAELNSLNAALAVIPWKRMIGFYRDAGREHSTTYQIATGELCNEERA